MGWKNMKYLGYLVVISFLDHVTTVGGLSMPITCKVFGVVVHEDKNSIVVASFLSENNIDENMDTHTIIRPAIKSIKVIRKEIVIK
jgi:hypothetical protein